LPFSPAEVCLAMWAVRPWGGSTLLLIWNSWAG
jgi:hypothetical protein